MITLENLVEAIATLQTFTKNKQVNKALALAIEGIQNKNIANVDLKLVNASFKNLVECAVNGLLDGVGRHNLEYDLYWLICKVEPRNAKSTYEKIWNRNDVKNKIYTKKINAEFFHNLHDVLNSAMRIDQAIVTLNGCVVKGHKAKEIATPVNPNKVVKTCPCCFRKIAIDSNGKMVHHGYKRPGQGWQTKSCMGIQFHPLEDSCDGTNYMINLFEEHVTKTNALIENSQNIDSLYLTRNPTVNPTVKITRTDPRWNMRFTSYISELRNDICATESSIRLAKNMLTKFGYYVN